MLTRRLISKFTAAFDHADAIDGQLMESVRNFVVQRQFQLKPRAACLLIFAPQTESKVRPDSDVAKRRG